MPNENSPADRPFEPVPRQAWRERVDQELKGAPYDKALRRRTPEGVTLEPLYTAEDWRCDGDPSGFPGRQPFTRGSTALSTADGWAVCPRLEGVDPDQLASDFARDLAGGAGAIWLPIDRAGRMGLDAGRPDAITYVGVDGSPLSSVDDMAGVFRETDPATIRWVIDAGANFIPAAATLLAWLADRGVDPGRIHCLLGADPLGALAADGEIPSTLETALEEMGELASYARDELPASRSVCVSTLPYHGAGAHAVQELAFAIGTGVDYLRSLDKAGLGAGDAAAQIVFRVAIGRDFFMEMAKLRALRLLWGKGVAACGSEAAAPYIHAVTSPRTLTRRDPWVNMLRVTSQSFAAVAGGAEMITALPFDEGFARPGALGRRVARNTQILLQEESHLGEVVDPAGGSWFVESLTEQLAAQAWEQFRAIERAGGMASCLLSGAIQAQVTESHNREAVRLALRKAPITGVSEFPDVEEKPIATSVAPDVGAEWTGTVRPLNVGAGLEALMAATGRRIGVCIDAAREGATVSLLGDALRRDTKRTTVERFALHRDSEPFEQLRDASDAAARQGSRPAVFLANLGTLPQHKARAGFAENLFGVGGMAVQHGTGTGEAMALGAARTLAGQFAASGAQVACICGTDSQYAAMGAEAARALAEAGAGRILLAGKGGEMEQALRDAGVSEFIFLGCDVQQLLGGLLAGLGVLR